MNKGKIHQIIGPVIDIKFSEDEMPELLNASGYRIRRQGHSDRGRSAYRVTMSQDAWRFHRLTDSEEAWKPWIREQPIQVPVGKEVLGRMFNVIGETIDEKGDVETDLRAAIHRAAPSV